jgi:hypothetical protein
MEQCMAPAGKKEQKSDAQNAYRIFVSGFFDKDFRLGHRYYFTAWQAT